MFSSCSCDAAVVSVAAAALVYNGCWCCIFKRSVLLWVALLSRLGGAFGGGGVLHRLALLRTHRRTLLRKSRTLSRLYDALKYIHSVIA